jgi:hypothetical protein
MDIDDLLAEVVSADSVPQQTRDLQELSRAWIAERVAPELLPWPEALMGRVLERVRRQVCVLCLFSSPWMCVVGIVSTCPRCKSTIAKGEDSLEQYVLRRSWGSEGLREWKC